MKKKIKKLIEFIKNNCLIINTSVIYFCIFSMLLFLTTDFFIYIKIPLVIISLYTLLYSYIIKYTNIKLVFKSSFFLWYFIFWFFTLVITIFRNNSQVLILIKNIIVFSMYIFDIILLYENNTMKSKFDLFKTIRIVSIFMCCWILLFEFKTLMSGERIGFSIMTSNPNGAGTVLATLLFGIVYTTKKDKKKIDFFIMGLLLFVITATGSKHAIIMAFVSLIYFLFKNGKIITKRLLLFLAVFIFSLVLVFSIPFLKKNIGERFLKLLGTMNIIEYEKDYSSTQRIKYSDKALELWQKNPVLGGGYNNVTINSGYNTYSHNNYLEILCTNGLIGIIVYYGYICYLIFCLSKIKKKKKMCLYDRQLIYILFLLSVMISDVGAITFSLYPFYYIIIYFIDRKYSLIFDVFKIFKKKGIINNET